MILKSGQSILRSWTKIIHKSMSKCLSTGRLKWLDPAKFDLDKYDDSCLEVAF